MRIHKLKLSTFRNIEAADLDFGTAQMVCLYGPNGAGKTNLLEALSLLTPGRGLHKDARDEQMMHGHKEWGLYAEMSQKGTPRTVGMRYIHGKGNRKIKIDDQPTKSQAELAALGNILWFTPKMDRLFLDAAQPRRDFIDRLTFGLFPEYAEQLARFKFHQKSRLKLIKDQAAADWIAIEEQHMVQHGLNVLRLRAAYMEKLAPHLPEVIINTQGKAQELLHEADAAAAFTHQLSTRREKDFLAGTTTYGPHRTDFDGTLSLGDNQTVTLSHTSTGQHKRAVLYILLAHARLMKAETGLAPVLLLDELTSHLDPAMRDHFFETLQALNAQVFVTGTDAELFKNMHKNNTIHIIVHNNNAKAHFSLDK